MGVFREVDPHEFSCRPFHIIGSDLMLITAAKPDGSVNTLTAGWGALGTMWGLPAAYVVIRPHRYTHEFVEASDVFSLCFFDPSYKKMMGYMGAVSGRSEDKIATAGLTVRTDRGAPYFEEASIVMCTTKLFAQPMAEENFLVPDVASKWYPEKDFHTQFIGRVDTILERQ